MTADPLAARSGNRCYHCGEALPPGSQLYLEVGDARYPMCCAGCRAVAALIHDSGLARFYSSRTAFNPRADRLPERDAYRAYDDDALQSQFVEPEGDAFARARLLVGGISCAACTWLIERTLLRLPAVRSAELNLQLHRLEVVFDRSRLKVSELLAQVAALGYDVQPWQSSRRRQQAQAEQRRDLRRLAVAGVGMMQVGMFAIALHAGELQGMDTPFRDLLRWVSLALSSFIVYYSARGFFASAWRHLRNGALVMDLPVALAIGVGWGASGVATLSGSGDVYFDSILMFTFLLLLARYLEARLRYRDALAWSDVEALLPATVRIYDNGDWREQPRARVMRGDRLLARGGETIPIDAVVEGGRSEVREDSFTGEAVPRPVAPGDAVFAGTLNIGASLTLIASGASSDTRLAALQASIDAARGSKPAVARLADRIAARFVGAVLLITAVTGAVWWQLEPARALWVALSVLIVSCPCALSLATPATLASAAAALRRRGIVVHGENALESLPRCSHWLFDKTGTITSGAFTLQRVQPLSPAWEQADLVAAAAALQRHSTHPLASAFADLSPSGDVQDVTAVPGFGMQGSYRGQLLRMGSLSFCRDLCAEFPDPPDGELYWVALGSADAPLAWLGLNDTVRPEAAALLDQLRAAGRVLELVTGDASGRAAALGAALGFHRTATGQSPDDKLARVTALQAQGATVAMVGDGLNDAPVLNRADVSIAVAGATDLTRAQADFVLLDGDLLQIRRLLALARRARRILLQNFAWALGYNLAALPAAALGMVPPWAAAIGMSLSSLLVVGNALRLRRTRS